MNFTSLYYVLGLPFVLAVHWLCPARLRWIWLLVVSVAFYAIGSPEAIALLALITAGTYLAARGIAATQSRRIRTVLCALATILCLGCLAWFKYAGFLVGTVAWLSGDAGTASIAADILLPAGISFYTFQTLSYVYDVARGRVAAERSLGRYALFVCFFPQLVAGPIERFSDLMPQLQDGNRTPDPDGVMILLRGFGEKLLIADTAAIYVDRIYAAPGEASGVAILLATTLFAMQIYYDFAGYSDIAIGTAALLGVRLRQNFDHPYVAASLRDFWRCWHRSLTQWFTDYVYIPLGGSRHGLLRQCRNILIVFLLSGLWHGAAWHYVAWGALHGILLVGETCLVSSGRAPHLPGWIAHGVTLLLVGLAWVFFRASDVPTAVLMLSRIPAGWSLPAIAGALVAIGARSLGLLLLGSVCLRLLPEQLPQNRTEVLTLFWFIVAIVCAYGHSLANVAENAFIYFQF